MTQKKPGIILGLEGPDGAGKDTFVAGFYAYLNEWFAYRHDDTKRGLPFESKVSYDQIKDHVPNTWPDTRTTIMGEMPTVKFMNIREGSESCAQFMQDIHSGAISDPSEVAKGYLKIHSEYMDKALELSREFDLVIMNRTLMSFECLQLRTMGLIECRTYFNQLVEKYQQNHLPHVVMLPPKEVVVARASAKTVSALDKVFTDKIDAAYAAYSDAVSRDTHENGRFKSVWQNVILAQGVGIEDHHPIYRILADKICQVHWEQIPDVPKTFEPKP